ncbi:MAG: hypothetical protein HYT80_03560 [Euryarchaeota archaeon]|nr:hypothetical protein [Euryarchaeota archaeon]
MEAATAPGAGERAFSVLAYLGPLVVVPLLKRKKPRFVFYHTRQGAYFFVLFLAAFILTFVPVLLMKDTRFDPSFLFTLFSVLLLLELTIYVILSLTLVVQAARGRMPMLPLLGEMAGEA